MVAEPSQEQISVWRSFLEAHSAVIKALERELVEDQGFPLTWYDVLVHLSEAPEARLQHQALAESLVLSRSGVSKHVANVFIKLGFDPTDDNRRVRAVLVWLRREGIHRAPSKLLEPR